MPNCRWCGRYRAIGEVVHLAEISSWQCRPQDQDGCDQAAAQSGLYPASESGPEAELAMAAREVRQGVPPPSIKAGEALDIAPRKRVSAGARP